MRLCERALQHAHTVGERSPRAASPEVELGVMLLDSAFNAARSILETKLPILTDAVQVTSIGEAIARLSHDAAVSVAAARSSVKVPPT